MAKTQYGIVLEFFDEMRLEFAETQFGNALE